MASTLTYPDFTGESISEPELSSNTLTTPSFSSEAIA